MAQPLATCLLNGQLLPLQEARISPLDRGFLFADAAYEVIVVRRSQARRLDHHLARLRRSLAQLRIADTCDPEQWRALIGRLIAANGGGNLYVYLQVSRGADSERNHAPLPQLVPTIFGFCAPWAPPSAEVLAQGVACITAEDTRWSRCDIKSVSLIANVLLRQQAIDDGAKEAILLRDGRLTEASASSVYVVADGQLCAPPNSPRILPGTTRSLVEELADQAGIARRVADVTEAQLRRADEIWLSGAALGLVAVTRLDGVPVGSGVPGPLWQRMYRMIEDYWNA
jgi:D-alanine transaminase